MEALKLKTPASSSATVPGRRSLSPPGCVRRALRNAVLCRPQGPMAPMGSADTVIGGGGGHLQPRDWKWRAGL